MADEPTFSVVMAAHDAARTVPAAIRSVLAQTRGDFELIVVDDGSTDATPDVVRAVDDPRVQLLRQANLGPAAARNAGLERARGPLVCLLDSDDLWLPRYLETMAAALTRDREAALAYTDAWRLDDGTRRIHRRTIMAQQRPPAEPPRDPDRLVAELLERNFVYTSATVRRAVLEDVGGFRTLTRSEDYELWLRIAASGRHFVPAGAVLAVYRDRPGSRIHDPAAMIRGRAEIYRAVLDSYELSPACRAVAKRRLSETERELAGTAGGPPPARTPGPLRRVVRDVRLFRTRPPADVRAAFRDLAAV
jgi:glycosyltransferase involved in cell wall biosynthesis